MVQFILIPVYLLIYLALAINPEFVKALDRRSKALENLGRLEDALVGKFNLFSIS